MKRIAVALTILTCGVATSLASAATIGSGSLVARPSQITGFASAKRDLHMTTSVSHYVRVLLEDKSTHAKREIAKLKAEGFQEAVTELLEGAHGKREALSTALVLGSAHAARAKLRSDLTEDIKTQGSKVKIARFTDARIPGSAGFTATESNGESGGAANILFTSGRCLILVGDFFADGKKSDTAQLSGPVLAGASALYPRVQKACS